MEVKLFLFKDNIILDTEDERIHRKVPEVINSAELQDIKSTHKTELYIYALAMSNMKRESNQDDITLVQYN